MEKSSALKLSKVIKDGFSMYLEKLPVFFTIDIITSSVFYLLILNPQKAQGLPGYPFIFLTALFLTLLNPGAIFFSLDKFSKGEDVKITDALKHGLARLPRIFLAVVLFQLAVAGGTILLIVPGIFLMLKYWYTIAAAAVEDKTVGPMNLASLMSNGNKGLIAGIIFLVYLPMFIILSGIQAVFSNNFLLSVFVVIPAVMVTTAAQAVSFTAYSRIRPLIPPETVKEKAQPMAAGLGCLIAAVIFGVVVIGGTVAGVAVATKTGLLEKGAKAVFGDTMELAGTKAKLPDGWWMIKTEEPFRTYIVFTDSKCLISFFAHDTQLPEKDAAAVVKDTVGEDLVPLINGKNAEYFAAIGRSQSLIILDKITRKPENARFAEKGWKKTAAVTAEGAVWNIFYKPGENSLAYVSYLGVTTACGMETEKKLESLFK